ncbi:MAG: PqqD family protein [Anaerolineae bacterium]|nr:PqqD family protein [Anaerolineae bacterium]MDW8098556.1 PqqD family protein [Anaerolineae bacterium]
MITVDLRPRLHPQVAGRMIGNEAVLVLADTGQVMVLNEVGGRIWELIDGSRTVADIARILVDEYEVSEEQALADLQTFIQELVEKQVLVV